MVIEKARELLSKIIVQNDLLDEDVVVSVKPLSPQEAIGNPERKDLPIVAGKERVIEANFRGSLAHAFTDSPENFHGKLKEVISLELDSNKKRAVFVATLNAILKYLGIIKSTIHCRDQEPDKCGREIAKELKKNSKIKTVGLIGFNPSILDALVQTFGKENVRVTDLNKENVGTEKYGVPVWDGIVMLQRLVSDVDIVLVTGTTFVNGTFDNIFSQICNFGKRYMVYGVTASGICELLNLPRICPYGRE